MMPFYNVKKNKLVSTAVTAFFLLFFSFDAFAATVCDDGCDYTSIKEAANNTGQNGTITVRAGKDYSESGINLFPNVTLTTDQPDRKGGVTITGDGTQPVIFADSGATIIGFKITNGNAGSWYSGGGIYAYGDLTVRNCIIRGNEASAGGGGGIWSPGSLSIFYSEITNNIAGVGGGIYTSNNLTISNSKINDNSSTGNGGGIFFGGDKGSIHNSEIIANRVSGTATAGGGGLYQTGSGSTTGNKLTIDNTSINANSVYITGGDASGGGIVAGRKVEIRGGSISNNRVIANLISTGKGGGILSFGDALELYGVDISGNSSSDLGGGVYEVGGLGTNIYYGGTISANTAADGAFGGGGIYCENPTTDRRLDTPVTGNTPDNILNCGGACTAGDTRSLDTGLYGSCAAGTQTCQSNNIWGPVTADNAKSREICGNKLDDDCDGYTDEEDSQCASGRSKANFAKSTNVSDPINTFTGELYFQESADLVLTGGPMDIVFQRYYASDLLLGGVLGNNWAHSFAWQLDLQGSNATIKSPQGKVIKFIKNVDWHTLKRYYAPYQLIENSSGLFRFNDPRNSIVYVFDSNNAGQLIAIENGRGSALALSYTSGLLTSVSDGLGRTLTLAYDSNNKINQLSDGARTVAFAYNGDGELVTASDAMSAVTSYAYDPLFVAQGKLVSRSRAAGNTPYTQTYINNAGTALHGRVSSQIDAAGNEITISYPADGGAGDTRIVNAEGNEQMHNYNASGELVSVSDAAATGATGESAGAKFSLDGNAIGQRAALTDRLGDTTRYSYHAASGKLASITHANGTSTRYSYTSRKIDGINYYDLSKITHADGSTQSFVYDQSGNLLNHTDQSGNLYTFTYNAAGQRLTAINPANGVATQTYSADGSLATLTDPAGNATSFAYDASNRLNLITRPDTTTRAFSYDANDRLLTSSDGNGNITTLTWDQNGNLQTVKTPLDATTTLAYDDNDRLIEVTDPLGGVNSTSYDAMGRVKTLTDANSNVTRLVYDAQSRPVSITDPLGNTWQTAYDLEGIPLSQTDPLDNTTTFTSNEMGWLIGVSSPLGNRTDFRYDEMGRLISTTDSLGQTSKVSRDARGLITATTLPGDTITTAYARNSLGQITVTTDPNGNNWKRTFDSSGRQTSSSDPLDKQRSNSYDNMNRLSVVTYPGDLGTQTLSYDGAGNLTGRSYSDGTSINYRYNAENRLTAADGISISYDANGRRTETNGIGISYDRGGRIVSMTLAADKAVTYAYDANDRLISVTDWMGGVTNFSYDAAGRITGITRPNGVNRTQSYDADSRLSSFDEGTVASSTFTRDANGQPTAVTRKAPLAVTATNMTARSNSYDAAAQIAGSSYDALGRLTAAGANSYTWDLASRLTAYTRDGSTVTAGYDAGGFRLSRRAGTSTRNYVWNMAIPLPVISVEKQGNTDLRYYIHTPAGALLYSVDANSNARSFYHYDEMGNTLFISNDAGDTIATYAYTPYGELLASTGNLDNPFTWQGQFGVMDEGNNFYYIRARYYDANTGRFISRDVIKGKGAKSVNPYQYAFLNPLLFVDVDGREPSVVTGDRYRLRTRGVDTTRYACEASPSRDEGLSASTFSIGTIAFDTGISGLAKLNSLREAVNKPSAKVPVPDFDNDPLAKATRAFSPTFDPVADEGLHLGFRTGKTRRIDAPKAQPKTPLQPKRSKTELNKNNKLDSEEGGVSFVKLVTDIFCTPEAPPRDLLNRELRDIDSAGDDVDTAADDLQAIVVLS